MPKAICSLKSYEWAYLGNLLAKGYPFAQAYAMIREDTQIQVHLEQGMDLKTILLQGHRGRFYAHLNFFLSLSSLADAIQCSLQMEAFEKTIRKKLIKQTSYPLVLFVFAFVTLYFFTMFIIPQMMQSFDMESENSLLSNGVKIMEVFTMLVACLLIVVIVTVFISIKHRKLREKFWNLCSRFCSIPADICSYTLSGYLIQLQTRGLPTQKAFAFLMQLHPTSLLYYVVVDIHKNLENGCDFLQTLQKQTFLNNDFMQCMRIGMHTQNLCDALQEAMLRQEEKWMRLIHRISITIQAFAYSFVALMVILVYQIMLVPLQILETM